MGLVSNEFVYNGMWIGFTHLLFRIPKDEYERMFKKMDELFFRVVSVLIAFLALRGPVKDSASKELFQAMGFADEFFPSAYLAVAHIILTFLGALFGAYFNDFRYFDEIAIVSGFAMCIWLVLLLKFWEKIIIANVALTIVALVVIYVYI